MVLKGWIDNSGNVYYAFEGEEHRLPETELKPLPFTPDVIKSTHLFDVEFPMLDSVECLDEWTKNNMREAQDAREMKVYQDASKDI